MDDFKDVVYSSRIRLARNINNLPFPSRLRGEEEIYSVLMKGVKDATEKVFKGKFYKMSDLDLLTAQTLIEKHLISPYLYENGDYSAAIVSDNEDISIMINEEDHIREQCILSGFNLEQAYNNIVKVDEEIAKRLDIAHDPKLGYLTACPTNLGAGMRASVMLFLPGLTMLGTINNWIDMCQQRGITTRGIYGEGSRAEGYLYQVSNQAAVGLSEKEIIRRLDVIVNSIVAAERQARKRLFRDNGIDLKDDIMRAYGTLKYAMKMSSSEFNKLIAYVKLGVSEKLIEADMDKINRLMVMTQPAMLCHLAKKSLSADERDITRAALIKKMLE